MALLELLSDIMESIVEDAASPIPGFLALATILRMVEFRGYEGKGEGGALSPRQRAEIERMLDSHYEKRIARGRPYYGRGKINE
jgi:hypothetical protein